MSNHYDIIFAGAGLSALSIATQMVDLPFFQTKKILLTDRDQKDKNDRTWCFWATNEEVNQLPPVLYKTWKNCHFYSPIHSEQLQIKPYQYHMVRGIDFYNWAKTKLSQHSNVHWEFGNITDMNVQTGSLQLNGKTFQSSWILNSAITPIQLRLGRYATKSLYPSPIKGEAKQGHQPCGVTRYFSPVRRALYMVTASLVSMSSRVPFLA